MHESTKSKFPRKVTLSIYVDEESISGVELLAIKTGISRNKIIATAIAEHLAKHA
jgi:hypothetical protein